MVIVSKKTIIGGAIGNALEMYDYVVKNKGAFMSKIPKRGAHWLEQNTLWESSGLSQQKFCEQQGLVYKQFIYWRGRLNRNKALNAEPKLQKVSTSPTRPPSQSISEPASCLEIILPTGIKLYIKEEADISKASKLIQLLGGA